ncbi:MULTISPECIES: hypothetical protein [Bacillales]|uniref:hypothetical protein n=1 Tax=Bacillales TaxID=1385 RepID=UPI00190A484E|nr:hypothetical protein [Staphylococcus aureus]MBK3312595.1 hypothetical protein [Staphylococcus aureus]WAI29906.1 MAG: hypothetical protein NRZ50_30625 [Bacillus paranthracis]WAI35779.1 MAG: hypothetical protein NRZ52_30420 [Bacillus paranthracis]WAI41550.1 MAG: hypothetical protein NRZ51_30555 [Bacillus paranthracis]
MPKIPKDIGKGGAYLNTDLGALLTSIVDDLNSLKTQQDDLKSKYNQHINDGKHRVATVVDAASPNSTVNSTITTTK